MSLLKKIKAYSNSILVLFDQAIVSGGNFLIGILLARVLGIDAYGVFALLWMIVLFGKSINEAFITKPMLSLAPKKEGEAATQYLGTLHVLELITVVLIGIFVFCFLQVSQLFDIEVPNPALYFIVPIVVSFHLLYEYYRKYFFVQQAIFFVTIFDGIMYVLQFGSIAYLYFQKELSITNVLLAIGLAHIVVCCIGFIKKNNLNFNIESLKAIIKHHFNFSKWLIGTAVLQWFSGNFFIIVAGGVIGTAAVGAVRIVQNVMGLTHVLFIAMENIVPVKAALHYKEGGKEQLYTYLKYITGRMGILIGAILIGLAIFRTQIIDFLYGEQYTSYSYLVIGFCLTYVLVFIGHPLRFALRTFEITKPMFISYILGTLFSVLLAYPLINNWGLIGLLVGIFVTQGLSQLVYLFYLRNVKQ